MKHIHLIFLLIFLVGCSPDQKAKNVKYNVEFLKNASCNKADFYQSEFVDDIKDFQDEDNIKIINKAKNAKKQCVIYQDIYTASSDIYKTLTIGTYIPEFIYLLPIDIQTGSEMQTLNIGYFHSKKECLLVSKKLEGSNIKTNPCYSRVLFWKAIWV